MQAQCRIHCYSGHTLQWNQNKSNSESKIRSVSLEQNGESISEAFKTKEVKIEQLERELFFYKKSSRELKKKLKELVGESVRHIQSHSKSMSIKTINHIYLTCNWSLNGVVALWFCI